MWETGRAEDLLSALREHIAQVVTAEVPLVYAPMALQHGEIDGLRALIRAECPLVDSPEFRSNPHAHPLCR